MLLFIYFFFQIQSCLCKIKRLLQNPGAQRKAGNAGQWAGRTWNCVRFTGTVCTDCVVAVAVFPAA